MLRLDPNIVGLLVGRIRLEGQFLVFVPEGNLKALGRAIRNVEGSLIFERA